MTENKVDNVNVSSILSEKLNSVVKIMLYFVE